MRIFNTITTAILIFTMMGGLASAQTQTVQYSSMLNDLRGYAQGTTGGRGGQLYTVTTLSDYSDGQTPIQGSLRYGVEELSGARWIVFDAAVFDSSYLTPATINVAANDPLRIESNTTIDGRGAKVRIVGDGTGIFFLGNAENVIIHNLIMTQNEYDNSLGDCITGWGDLRLIWISQNTFSECGDGVIDITNVSGAPNKVTISNNHISDHRKVMLLGNVNDPTDNLQVSIYENVFEDTFSRQPLATKSRVHVFNNVYKNFSLAVDSRDGAEAWIEENVFRVGNQVSETGNGTAPGFVRLEDNLIDGSIPATENPSGVNDPFYAYPYHIRKLRNSASVWEQRIRDLAGWKDEPLELAY